MKFRSCFVANSSSMSFIVRALNSYTVALQLLQITYDYYTSDSTITIAQSIAFNRMFTNLELHRNENINYLISNTCNEETYIAASKCGEVVVDTCRNQDWDDMDFIKPLYDDYRLRNTSLVFLDLLDNRFKTRDEYWEEYKQRGNDPLQLLDFDPPV